MRLSLLRAAATAAALLSAGPAAAQVVYDNGAPQNNTWSAFAGPYAVYQGFTLSAPTTFTGIRFQYGLFTSQVPYTGAYNWAIRTNPHSPGVDLGSPVTAGTGAATSQTLARIGCCPYTDYQVDLGTGTVSLAAGSYFLMLQMAGPVPAGWSPGWANTAYSPSQLSVQTVNGVASYYNPNNMSFQLRTDIAGVTPPVSAVPEPATWSALGAGLLALGVAERRRRRATA